ncbi:AbrB/MazE/SpoVT family DNA-binding domain-containing protein [Sphingomonas bacterium]|uniref:AbrB/MazE/SpoVT family DNA-binding domain-containing protein n=1 Tax=Sphingomonas bacterium TaxID=1895847 RepID=UPI001576225D|nr:AbrB/MazE/SpoVT family DNA-binding domain-containing protein [Sphingomonas bacterium]
MNTPLDRRTTTNMTSKGQVLIPKDVREAIGLVPGRPVDVGVNDRGEAVVVPSVRRAAETPEMRSARIMAAFRQASARHRTGRDVDTMMAELRGDEPLP